MKFKNYNLSCKKWMRKPWTIKSKWNPKTKKSSRWTNILRICSKSLQRVSIASSNTKRGTTYSSWRIRSWRIIYWRWMNRLSCTRLSSRIKNWQLRWRRKRWRIRWMTWLQKCRSSARITAVQGLIRWRRNRSQGGRLSRRRPRSSCRTNSKISRPKSWRHARTKTACSPSRRSLEVDTKTLKTSATETTPEARTSSKTSTMPQRQEVSSTVAK